MAEPIDPVSQIIGSLSAQVTGLLGAVGELKADILQNRIQAQAHREREIKMWEQVEAELRNVKHDQRGVEQKMVSLTDRYERRLVDVEGVLAAKIAATDLKVQTTAKELSAIDETIKKWQARLALLAGAGTGVGTLIGILVEVVFHHYVERLW